MTKKAAPVRVPAPAPALRVLNLRAVRRAAIANRNLAPHLKHAFGHAFYALSTEKF